MDITELMQEATKEMPPGTMIHSDCFNLYEAMSALELMDPKMDAGSNSEDVKTPEERLEAGEMRLELSPEEALSICDALLGLEMLWCDGNSLAQTIFTCLYVHPAVLIRLKNLAKQCAPDSISPIVTSDREIEDVSSSAMLGLAVAAFGTALLKTCGLMRNAVLRADIYEEEDFAPATYGVDLATNTSHDELLTLLNEAKQTLIKYLQQTSQTLDDQGSKAKSKKRRKGKKGGGGGAEHKMDGNVDGPLINALIVHLQYRRSSYISHVHMSRSCKDDDLIAAKAALQDAQIQLNIIADRIKADSPAKPAEAAETITKPNLFGFDSTISRCLPSSTPPRVLPSIPLHQAVIELKGIVESFQFVCNAPENDTLEAIDSMMETFSKMLPAPKVCARSYLLLFLYTDAGGIMGRLDIQQLIQSSFVSMGVPRLLFNTEESAQLVLQLVKPVYELLRVHTLSRARQRQRLEELFEDWAFLQSHAEEIDQHFMAAIGLASTSEGAHYLSGWMLEQVLKMMTRHLSLGLELELFSIHETDWVLWYLDFLLGIRLQNRRLAASMIERMRQQQERHKQEQKARQAEASVNEDKTAASAVAASSGSSKKKGKRGKKEKPVHKANASPPRPSPLAKGQLQLEAERSLCRGIFRFLSALRETKFLSTPDYKYGRDDVRFNRRFQCFSVFSNPAPLTRLDYVKNCCISRRHQESAFESSLECFKTCKKIIDQLIQHDDLPDYTIASFRVLSKVSGANAESLMRVQKLRASDQAGPSLAFELHKTYPVLTV